MPDRARLLRLAAFVLAYALLQAGYQHLRGGPAAVWLIDRFTAVPAAALIDTLRPADGVTAQGPRLVWPGGRLQLLAGCDGVEVLALLLAAALAAPLPWRRRLMLIAAGTLLVWALNQLRLLGLYLSFREWRAGFEALHVVVGPLLMLGMVAAWFSRALRRGP